MGFLRSTKGSIISDYFKLQEDIAGFSKGYMYDVALYDDHLEITGTKSEKELHRCFIISYTSSDGEDKYMQFEDTRKYKGNKLYKKLKNLAHVESESIPDIQNL